MTKRQCRSCGGSSLVPLLSLGKQPLANALERPGDVACERYPLDIGLCESCGLVQILDPLSPEKLFADYPYRSSVAATMVRHAAGLVAKICDERRLGRDDLVVEIGSNDGYLLQFYRGRRIAVLGVEPSAKLAEEARRSHGIDCLEEFFDLALAERMAESGRRASVIHVHNVFAHVPAPRDFAKGLRRLLRPDGIAIIEAPYLLDLIDGGQFDTIYHEHFSYFSLTAMQPIWDAAELEVVDVERIPIHGGSLRMTLAAKSGAAVPARFAALLQEEAARGIRNASCYRGFASTVVRRRSELLALIAELRSQGRRLAGYGASAKASVLLNYAGLDRKEIEYVVDLSPSKQGRLIPGTHIPIVALDTLRADPPDYLLLLVRNLKAEVLDQERAFLDAGGQFIVPLPEISIIPTPRR